MLLLPPSLLPFSLIRPPRTSPFLLSTAIHLCSSFIREDRFSGPCRSVPLRIASGVIVLLGKKSTTILGTAGDRDTPKRPSERKGKKGGGKEEEEEEEEEKESPASPPPPRPSRFLRGVFSNARVSRAYTWLLKGSKIFDNTRGCIEFQNKNRSRRPDE